MSSGTLLSIPAAWLLAILPHVYSTFMYNSASKSQMDPKNPRGFPQQVASDQSLPAILRCRILRAEAAHLNGLENLGFYAAAVVAAYAANVNPSLLNGLAWAYIGSRSVYNYIYIYNDKFSAYARTAVYVFGIGLILGLFVLAAQA